MVRAQFKMKTNSTSSGALPKQNTAKMALPEKPFLILKKKRKYRKLLSGRLICWKWKIQTKSSR